MEVDGVSWRSTFRDLRETVGHPGVDLSQTELTGQLQLVHGPGHKWSSNTVVARSYILFLYQMLNKAK